MVADVKQLAVLCVILLAAAFWLLRAEHVTDEQIAAPLLSWRTPVSRLMFQPPDERIAMPLWSVRVRQIGDTWHALRSGRRRHEGQDIFAPVGTAVYSATNGILIRMGDAGKGGNAVSVLGAGGRVYYYAHLLSFAEHLRVGHSVTPATVIGYVGRTGNAVKTPSHLHFGVYDFTGAINPLPLLVNRGCAVDKPVRGVCSDQLHWETPTTFFECRTAARGVNPVRSVLRASRR